MRSIGSERNTRAGSEQLTRVEKPVRERADVRAPGAGLEAEPLLAVRDLRVSFFLDEGVVRAVDGVSFDVFPGQVVGIVGESGCGKSVTMRAILQLVEPPGRIVSGRILFRQRVAAGAATDGVVDLARLHPRGAAMRAIRGAEIALIPQEPMAAFSPVHTVGDQIIEAILLHHRKWRPDGSPLGRREARQITVELFRDVGISMPEARVDAYSWQLSGGLRQRAMIAMALSCQPRLLIADEPTTAIDVTTQAQVLNLLRELQRKYRTAIVFITHDLGVIAQIAYYVVVMYLGRVMEQGPVDDIFHAAKHPYTRALLRSIPSVRARPRARLPIIAGSLPHPFNRPPGCPFHPRCADVLPGGVCARRVPSLQPVGERQAVSCFLYHDVAEES
jgi:peptide/nickel transport system ATP-binding protein